MFSSLSKTQEKIVFEKSGKFVVRACPGSGKTYSVAARAAYRIQNWESKRVGIALLSFTNAAWHEIQNKLESNFNVFAATKYPHFLGTLDSFINQYIFLPFGHLLMGCKSRPLLVGEPHSSWNYGFRYEQYFDIVSYNIDDSLLYPARPGVFFFNYQELSKTNSKHANNIRTMKQKFWKEGYATQNDANYFAVKVLEKFPSIAKSLVTRFPEFIIDEAQDTTEAQIRLIDLLIENGLNEVVLIGDPNQAIFEWNTAKPALFSEKYDAWKENSLDFNENRRSSQLICNFTAKLTSLPSPPVAITNEVKDCDYPIEIIAYDYKNRDSVIRTIENFVNKCRGYGIRTTPETAAVLFRGKDFIDIILGVPSPKSKDANKFSLDDAVTKDIVKAKLLIDKHHFREGYMLLEKAFVKAINKKNCGDKDIQTRIDQVGIIQHRKEIYDLASRLPSTKDADIKTWIDEANCNLTDLDFKLRTNGSGSMLVNKLFQKEIPIVSDDYRLGTVHSVKGETFDAVLLLLKKKGTQGKYYKKLLKEQTKTDQNEELRIVYVAMTRPRKFLMLAVPEDDQGCWKELID